MREFETVLITKVTVMCVQNTITNMRFVPDTSPCDIVLTNPRTVTAWFSAFTRLPHVGIGFDYLGLVSVPFSEGLDHGQVISRGFPLFKIRQNKRMEAISC